MRRDSDLWQTYTMVARSGLVYNFDVLHDPSGAKGMAWIRAILLEKVND